MSRDIIIWCERDTCLCLGWLDGKGHCTFTDTTGNDECPRFENRKMYERRMKGLDRRELNPDMLIDTMGNFEIYEREYYPGWMWRSNEPTKSYYGLNKESGYKTSGYGYLNQLRDDIPKRKDYTASDNMESRVYQVIKGTSLDSEIAAELGIDLEIVNKTITNLAEKNMVKVRTIKKEDGLHSIVTKIKG